MEVTEITLTPQDRLILQSYASFMDAMKEYMGDGYEMVLHSLENLDHSVIKIINGHHTGRREGAPITDLALGMLERIYQGQSGNFICYQTKNKKGEPLKACTVAIRGEEDKIIGVMCINFYLNTPLYSLLAQFSTPTAQPVLFEAFGSSAGELIEQAVAQATSQVMGDGSVPPSLKNREIVVMLRKQGIFKIKNAVEQVAAAMGISKNTVYLHLRNQGH